MWIAVVVAVLAAAVAGAAIWWLRRGRATAEAGPGRETGPGPEAEDRQGWELGLTPEVGAAFMEGLRAWSRAGEALPAGAERGVLTTYDPPRLISLHLLADAFAARGDAALHDPEGTVAAVVERLAGSERPGVLHLRGDWLDGEVDGLDRARFAAAVREALYAEGDWAGDEAVGAMHVTVTGARPATEAATLMLDLARVLDRYREARAASPDAAAEALLREVAPALVTAGGPGLTWTKPPTEEELQAVLTGSLQPR
ncbi:hypothetical protein [Nonomuraea jiangxiensis]|uniref:Uncharacterized protein n=1 Tax=Nonomuraea jiangxiensis TaxID=633440 RepID=A0A1G9DM27_9ACTN|nr:hypothetical protein [Nonomuraea jiangxiensis]SDK64957.1 hypothetical protein SAMN05421869_117187 [Nonomuraea jiangxiensis]